MTKLLIFGGTSEEHGLIEALSPFQVEVTLCVASDYGKMMVPANRPGLEVLTGRLDKAQMTALMTCGFLCVIDSTHPYATEVTKNIKAAAVEAKIPYLRLMRERSTLGNATVVGSPQEAAVLLNDSTGNVLLTTGSKDLTVFTAVSNYRERLYARVLPTTESIDAALSNGYQSSHIIAMHGPFSKELNVALMQQFDIKTIVTKDGGIPGGFPAKMEAAAELNAALIVIERPADDGLSETDIIARISSLLEART